MKRLLSMTAVAVLAVGGLTSCGGDSDYCKAAAEAGSSFDPTTEGGLKLFQELRDAAPDEIKDDFDLLLGLLVDPTSVDLSDPELQAKYTDAGNAIDDYTTKECDVKFST